MITITGEDKYEAVQHIVCDVGDEVICIDWGPQIDDLMIVASNGDVLLSWDADGWQENECILLSVHDNMKEIGNIRCTKLYMKSAVPGSVVKVYATGQRN
jgi:hypothetical protein